MRTSVEQVTSHATLADEWRRLYAMSEQNFFLSPPWIETWLGATPDSVKISVVRAYDDLRGVFALAIVGVPARKNVAAFSQARLHETGIEAHDRVYIEYNDVLTARNAPSGTRREMVVALLDAMPKVEEFVFRNARSSLAGCVAAVAAEKGCEYQELLVQPSFQIDLKSAGASVFNGFSSSLKTKIRRAMRRYEERGEIRLERAQPGVERTIAWTELMRLHAETWSRRGADGVFREKDFMGFHERLLERYPTSVDLVRLIAGGDAVGALYNFIAGDRVYNYQSGFRYESDNQLAPGFVCHALAADRYREDGFATYDMMGGDAEYKRRLGVEGESLKTVVLTRRGLRSSLRSLAKSVRRVRSEGTRQT